MLTADLIVAARRRAGLTQRELAARLGRPQATIARWESGRNAPSLETARAALNAIGLELTVGIATYDDSYHTLIDRQLRLTPAQRLDSLLPAEPFDPAAIMGALAAHHVRYVVIGAVAAALHGSPITLGRRELALVPQTREHNEAALAHALDALEAQRNELDDYFCGLHTIEPWRLPDGSAIHVIPKPAGTRGYDDLARDATPIQAAPGVRVAAASLVDLTRIAEASPRPGDRTNRVALRTVRERILRRNATPAAQVPSETAVA